jgi:hypothetical protein
MTGTVAVTSSSNGARRGYVETYGAHKHGWCVARFRVDHYCSDIGAQNRADRWL